ncbi:acyl-CoA dehydrogenase family protein [Rhodococcus sp. NPDC003318]|uniref:acyl-CoA dehydrogenase family protein n=1 Tax=Rhodococcus sp. NPDC003318 TaxID=3364503 RepID=UPI0036BBC3E0
MTVTLEAAVDTTSADRVDAADEHPLVARVRDYAHGTLAPRALQTDREGVTAGTVEELRRLGLLNHLAPAGFGGAELDTAAERRVHEHLAYGDFNTWLAWAQHTGLIVHYTTLAKSGASIGARGERVLRGEILSGTAISDARHYPTRYVRADPVEGGWTITGTVSWVSGWGINALLSVAAIDPTTETQLLALIDVDDERLRAEPLALVAAAGSRTWRVTFEGVFVAEADIVKRTPRSEWNHRDRNIVSDVRPQVFGVARAILDELHASGEDAAAAVARAWEPPFARYRALAYALTDRAESDPKGPQHFEDRLALKVEVLRSLQDIARALVVSRAGSGILATDTAALHARSALFLQVQSQNEHSRAAQLADIASAAP